MLHTFTRRAAVQFVFVVALAAPAGVATAQPVTRPRSATDTMSYVYLRGTDTVAIERTVRRADGVRGELIVKNQPRVVWHQHIGAGHLPTAFDVDAYAATASAGAAPMQSLTLRVVGDSAFVDVNSNGSTNTTQRLPLPVGTEWMLNTSMLHTDVLASLALLRNQTEVRVVLAQGGQQTSLTLRALGDTTVVTSAAGDTRFIHDALGLKEASVGTNMVVRRVAAADEARLRQKAADEKASYPAPAGAPYTAQDVVITTASGFQLAGTLTKPRGAIRAPVVVTISGSGEQERDSRLQGIAGYAIFRDIADTLARRGIAVLRVDDRGVGASTGRESRAVATSADYASDVREVVNYLRTRKDIDTNRIALLGHSEGGMIAPMVAAKDQGIHAVVLLAGPAYTGRRISMFQNEDGLRQQTQITAATRDSILRLVPAQLDSVGKINPWIGFYLQHDPVRIAKQVTQPVLILQGATDHQITPEQADTLAVAFRSGGNKDVTIKRFANTDHLFLADSSGVVSGYAALASKKVRADVLGALADWLVVKLR